MVGITACSAYIPVYRLGSETTGWGKKNEKAVAGYDEDSISMAVAAIINCLSDLNRDSIDALYLASTTFPYKEKLNGTVVAAAADLRPGVPVADFGNSLRAGTIALKLAVDSVKAGSVKQTMVAASDMRVAKPDSEVESTIGDGAAALLIGDSNVIAEVEDCYSISQELLDIWEAEGDTFIRTWEDRFVLEEGYLNLLPQAISSLMDKHKLEAKDFSKAVFYAPDTRRHQEMAKRLGFDLKTQVQDPLLNTVGNTGAASAIMMLVAALEEAKPGDRILLANYGNGADAFIFRVTEKIEAFKRNMRGVKALLSSKKFLPSYDTFLSWHGLIDKAPAVRRPPLRTPSPAAMLREVDKNLRLHGTRCKQCGYPQYPPQRICTRCHAKDDFEDYSFSDKKAKVFTYTMDYLAPTLDPPMVVAVIDFEGGGRTFSIVTDRDTGEIKIGMPVEMTFRKFYTSEGIHNYIWKCMPPRA